MDAISHFPNTGSIWIRHFDGAYFKTVQKWEVVLATENARFQCNKLTEEAKNRTDFLTTKWEIFVSNYVPKVYPNNKEMNRDFLSIRI